MSVTFDDQPAELLYKSATQINLQVPSGLGSKDSAQVVVTVDGNRSAPFTAALSPAWPSIFSHGVLNQDNTVNSPDSAARPGQVLQIYATGIPRGATVSVAIGSRENLVPLYAGEAPTAPGVQQVNVAIPDDIVASNMRLSICAQAGRPADLLVRLHARRAVDYARSSGLTTWPATSVKRKWRPLVLIGEARVLHAQAVQNRSLQVVDVHRVLDDVVAILVGLTHRDAGLDAAARHPHREASGMMVAAVIGGREAALAVNGAPEFAAPDHQRVVEHAALFEVGDERGGGLIGFAAQLRQAVWAACRDGPNRDGRAE